MADPHSHDEPVPDIRKEEESTVVHNIQQMLGCLPVLGSAAVGIGGLIAFGIGINNTGRADQPGWSWLMAGSIGLIASGIGFAALGWLVWGNRRT